MSSTKTIKMSALYCIVCNGFSKLNVQAYFVLHTFTDTSRVFAH